VCAIFDGFPSFVTLSKTGSRDTLTTALVDVGAAKRRSWHDMVTLDESRLHLNMDHEAIWLQPDEDISERERRTLSSEKVMITIIWNSSGFHLIKLLANGLKFNASYYVTQIRDPLSVWPGT
jgi:hypothetical protein